MPVMGMIPMVIPAFWKTLKAMKANRPVQIRRPKVSRATTAACSTRQAITPRRARTPTEPTKPSCSATAVKMKSVCCSGT